METNESKETQAILAMGEKLATYEAEIARLTTRVQELETIVANQRAEIKELQ
jgi:predicted RNase H-like nuclease (RuvC/YqgF family)